VSRVRVSIGFACAAAAFAGATTSGVAAVGPCAPSALSARMAVVVGSAGAGNISYRLLLRNVSSAACTVSGHPGLRLRGAGARALPTRVTGIPPGAATAVLVTLAPGQSATATLRFSPDVPGPGEQHPGQCEPTAHSVKVTLASPGSGSLPGPIKPPTPVCEHGSMTETLLSKA